MPKRTFEGTNQDRAELAGEAVCSYAGNGRYFDPNPAELLGDLLGDLRHWAKAMGVDFEQCDRNARICFENEVREEGEDTGSDFCDYCHSSSASVNHTDDVGNKVCVRCAREDEDMEVEEIGQGKDDSNV